MSITKVWACTAYPMRCRFLPFWIQSNICKWLFSATNGDKIISNLIHTANVSNIKITVFFLGPVLFFCLVLLQIQNYFGHVQIVLKMSNFVLDRCKHFGQVQKLWTGTKKNSVLCKFHILNRVQNHLKVSKTVWTGPKLLIASILAWDP